MAALHERRRTARTHVEPADADRSRSGVFDRGRPGAEALRARRYAAWFPLKRAFDVGVALPFGLVILPVVAVAALLVVRADPGPPLYAQVRVGRFGRPFRLWKLRTMTREADAALERYLRDRATVRRRWEAHFKLTHDPRVIPGVGTFLRRSSLDELPQLWNVVRGDMSLVGPRPLPPYHLAAFDAATRAARARVLPGLTGLEQVAARGDADLRAQRAWDLTYVGRWTPWLDLTILLRTPAAVLRGRGAH